MLINRPPIKSSMSDPETRALQLLVDGRRAVEAGALLGYSALAMARTAAKVVSIDRHEGYGPSTYRPYMSNLVRFGDMNQIRPLRADAINVLPGLEADVAFIDLTGTEDVTALALASLHPSIQFAAVHDFGRSSCRGVELALHRSPWRVVHVVDTLAIARKAA